jgi:aquaporin Z
VESRKLVVEALGTALLVFVGCGMATLMFGFHLFGTSRAAGVVTTAFAFGLVLTILAYTFGPISGCHINPAVTLGFLASRRISVNEAIAYWAAQFTGGIVGALVLWGIMSGSPVYSRSTVGLGANGFGKQSMIGINTAGAFFTEVIITFLFVLVVLGATSRLGNATLAGLAIGLGLATANLVGIPITGASVNPARSLGPALIVGGPALSQVWLFIVAPLIGGACAAGLYRTLWPGEVRGAGHEALGHHTPPGT